MIIPNNTTENVGTFVEELLIFLIRKNGRFSAQFELVRLRSRHKTVFLGNIKTFEEKKNYIAFLRPNICISRANSIFQALPNYFLILVNISS